MIEIKKEFKNPECLNYECGVRHGLSNYYAENERLSQETMRLKDELDSAIETIKGKGDNKLKEQQYLQDSYDNKKRSEYADAQNALLESQNEALNAKNIELVAQKDMLLKENASFKSIYQLEDEYKELSEKLKVIRKEYSYKKNKSTYCSVEIEKLQVKIESLQERYDTAYLEIKPLLKEKESLVRTIRYYKSINSFNRDIKRWIKNIFTKKNEFE